MRKKLKYEKEAKIALIALTGALIVTVGVSIFNSNKEKENFTTAVYNSKEYSCFDECADKIITLNELFKDMTDDVNYNAVKIISKDFTNTKVEIEIEEIVLTKEQAQEELSSLKGQTVIIE